MAEHIDKLQEENKNLREEIALLRKELSTNPYKVLFEATPDIIIQVDTNYKIIVINIPNHPAHRLEQLRGQDLFVATPPEFHAIVSDSLKKVFSSGETVRYESEGIVLGNYRYYDNYLTPIKDESGTIYSASFIIREVTQQKIFEKTVLESERKLRALFGSSQHLHVLMDMDQKLVWFNQKALDTSKLLFKNPLEVGFPMSDFLRIEFKSKFDQDFELSKKGEVVIYERHYLIMGGTQSFYLEMMLQPMYEDNQIIGISLVGMETTERKLNEEKLERVNHELVQQNQRLNQYSYIISHNLRGPIVTLLGLVNLFEQNKDDLIREQVITHIKTSALHLDNIIKDLNVILSQTGKDLNKDVVNLEAELTIIKDLLKVQIESISITIHTNWDKVKEIYTVKSFLQSILLNLLSNSIKYKRKDVPLEVNISTRITPDQRICLSFSDNGMGFDLDKNKDKIFGIYKRFHPHIEGKGLGLYLVKTQIDLMGGEIEVESQVDNGTTFRLYFGI